MSRIVEFQELIWMAQRRSARCYEIFPRIFGYLYEHADYMA